MNIADHGAQRPNWPREAQLKYLEIRDPDICAPFDALIQRGKKAAIGRVIRASTRIASSIRSLDEQAQAIAAAQRKREPIPESLWFFDPQRPVAALRALTYLQQELAWLLSRPDSFWQRRPQHAWRPAQ